MTSKLNREQLRARAVKKIESLNFAITQSAFTNIRLSLEEELQLAEFALAAMDSEPVILYRQVNPANGMKTYWAELDLEEFRHLKQYADENAEFMTLYRHAQPAPVVQENRAITKHFDTMALETAREILCDVNRRHEFPGGEFQFLSRIQCRIDEACRAAMLQAGTLTNEGTKQAGNSPVIPCAEQRIADAVELLKQAAPAMLADNGGPNGPLVGRLKSPVIPDGYRLQPISEYEAMCATVNSDEWPQRWIPVSEQMPEDRTQVILWDAEIGEVTSGHYSHKTHTFYHCGDAIENEITHWMPPPCAPQEVNHG
ncbi:DUF551 domain-containing protein [Raoultella ornithinolytica]|uniref:DUF551 domain-containing protein n=1 Tax=Raoultella ornithinolytica TaxID=54291 RepID=UPI00190CCA0F|nr:DUF551 domain-containing protein [Raoultella ornithinolytica]MBK2607447.1 DUF551 domain-containing protein [Raoultella ornithinolytica]